MALFIEFKPLLGEIARYLRILATKDCCANAPSAGTQALGNPATLTGSFNSLKVRKTNASGTVTITFADATSYTLTADGEELSINRGGKIGDVTIAVASGATYKFVTA